MIFAGVALAPAIHPSVLKACAGYPAGGAGAAASPASALRTFALLVALARGGMSMNVARLRDARWGGTILALSWAPYFAELVALAGAARALLPDASGVSAAAPAVVSYLAASTWAPLSPSIVIPNMLTFKDAFALPRTAGVVLTGAPLEVGTALIVFSAIEGAAKTLADPSSGTLASALAWIPVQLLGSLALGGAGAGVFWAYHAHARSHPLALRVLGKREGAETLLVFLAIFVSLYAVCTDYYVPKLVGLLSALGCGVGVQLLTPDLAPVLVAQLAWVWTFAETFLFVLTGVIVRSAIDSSSPAFSGSFFGVLLIGSLARLAGQMLVAAWWHVSAGGRLAGPAARTLALRTAFLWVVTMPKATLQASLGPKPASEAAALAISALTGAFIAQSAAFAILWMTLIGSVLTYTVGRWVAAQLELEDHAIEAAAAAASAGAAAGAGAGAGAGADTADTARGTAPPGAGAGAADATTAGAPAAAAAGGRTLLAAASSVELLPAAEKRAADDAELAEEEEGAAVVVRDRPTAAAAEAAV